MANASTIPAFSIALNDPLAEEHQAVSAWVEESINQPGELHYARDIDLKSLPSGQRLLAYKPDQARRCVVAAVAQVQHWDHAADQLRSEHPHPQSMPQWPGVWGRRRRAETVISSLMRRSLPFQKQDLLQLLHWCQQAGIITPYFAPLGAITRALERYAAQQPLDEELATAARSFAAKLRASHEKDAQRLGTTVEQLSAPSADQTASTHTESSAVVHRPSPQPAPAGHPQILVQLKRLHGMLSDDQESPVTEIGPDQFPLPNDSPLASEHQLLTELLQEVIGTPAYSNPNLEQLQAGESLLALPPDEAGRALLAAGERHVNALLPRRTDLSDYAGWQCRYAAAGIVAPLTATAFRLSRDGLFDFALYLASRAAYGRDSLEEMTTQLLNSIERTTQDTPLSEGERYVLSLLRISLISGPPLGRPASEIVRLTNLIGDNLGFCLQPGEVWSDAVNADFTNFTAHKRQAWAALFAHAITATTARPSEKWLKAAAKLVEALGVDHVRVQLERWLPLVTQGRSVQKLGAYAGDTRGSANTMLEENATCLRGLLWITANLPEAEKLARLITTVAVSAYKKVPGVGPRAVKVGNAAVYALSQIGNTEAVGQLAMLKVRVKFGTAQKEIEKAFNTTAEALGLPRDQIEELGVPSYGLEEGGVRREEFGDYRAELIVAGSEAELKWFDAAGKPLKSVPAKVKKDHAEDFKDLQQSLKDIQGMLPAQRDRIDGMFLLQKSWPLDAWRERYLEHPLVGTIAARLIWCVDGVPALFVNGTPTNVEGQAIEPGPAAEITLWHPVGRSVEEVTSWRRRLEQLGITQPFKQAHREVYLLTDAERNTGTYSNRFAAHVLRQHQFNALCAARGWKNRLRLMVDDSYEPPFKELPQWGLRAEFWVEGIGDGYGTDTNDSGVYLRLSTDQVRFYRPEATVNYAHASGGGYTTRAAGPGPDNVNAPLPLEQIPPLVFSEIMRDVDLFVGVASVGNDPTWQDGGPEGRYRDYWQSYSFGELSGTASTRKQVLERLVPRLKIADRCSFSERFLIVRGQKRTYKIHLGSGNILMEPNDQYLCIVPDSRSRANQENLFLPFEGDATLSIIISKALLLADDTKIKDPTITRQIEG